MGEEVKRIQAAGNTLEQQVSQLSHQLAHIKGDFDTMMATVANVEAQEQETATLLT